ncbi:unnamed protein product [Didymodactylos carnosus]|uniref:Acylphosphatase n=1 Tax=Didymodactylos carnosus TaxID=1234261 RepID=A0A813RHF8_9BILA|nr:unnamed protein product [Didymodactylos carnosus]CAF0784523.1 unnamed protein product [Didymodactylos carnosus]CAF3545485.1 unnamed protein product [Didymodactylos carnosus]CAF3568124.1 unnamed protein product [Didymodactylos carnosus]
MSMLAHSCAVRSLFEVVNRVCILQTVSLSTMSTKQSQPTASSGNSAASSDLAHCDFEVYGRVQGVFFRKHTIEQAKKLQLTGWVRNTEQGTVQGELEGKKAKIDEMKKWLEKTGSPKSRIDKALFSNEKSIDKQKLNSFTQK